METLDQYYKDGVYYGVTVIYGTSSDVKPTCYGNGSKFIETDTGRVYTFSANDNSWKLAGAVANLIHTYVADILTESPQEIGELEDGEWVCSVIYPLNLDITVATNSDNKVIATSENYRGAVVALCFKV